MGVMHMSKILSCLVVLLFLQACSGKQVYQALQESQRQRCEQELIPSVYRECMARGRQSYEEYEEERGQL